MKTYSVFAIGIIIGLIFGFIIFVSTPIGHRYEHVALAPYALIKYDRWSGELSAIYGPTVLNYVADHKNNWVILPKEKKIVLPTEDDIIQELEDMLSQQEEEEEEKDSD